MKIIEIKKEVDLSKCDWPGAEREETRYAIADDDGNVVDDAQGSMATRLQNLLQKQCGGNSKMERRKLANKLLGGEIIKTCMLKFKNFLK